MTTEYVSQITAAYPAIREVWLIGSRANGTEGASSDWDYLAFADDNTLADLSRSVRFNWRGVDLLVVVDKVNFAEPWVNDKGQKTGSLAADDWNWKRITETEASYRATKPGPDDWSTRVFEQRARRVYSSVCVNHSGVLR